MRDPVALMSLLESRAFRMDFFHVLRLIENAYPDCPRIGESPRARDDAVRFGQDPELNFQPTMLGQFQVTRRSVARRNFEVERPSLEENESDLSLVIDQSGADSQISCDESSDKKQARLAVNFFGLLGPNGPMPIHFTEYVRDRLRNAGDATLARFLDIFHHRMLSLFYRARAAAEPAISLDRPHADRFSQYVGSMFGLGTPALRHRDEVPDFAKLHFSGLLASHTRPASGLVSILTAFFKLPIHIEQFVGHWMRLPPEVGTRLGGGREDHQLGKTTVLGRCVWDVQNKFRLVIGPIGYGDYLRMLPGGDSMQRLIAWVRNYVGDVFDWDVQLILQRDEIPSLKLGGGMRLGWSTWLINRTPTQDADQLFIQPMAYRFNL